MINYGPIYKYLDRLAHDEGGDYWNVRPLLTYGRPLIVETSARDIGKSTMIAGLALLDYIVQGHKFVYFRRYKEQTRITAKTFFSGVPELLKEKCGVQIDAFKYDKSKYWIGTDTGEEDQHGRKVYQWEECGEAFALSREEDFKSARFPDTYTLIGDEFISKDDTNYLGGRLNPDKEWDAIMSLYDTVDRRRNQTTLFLLGNKATMYNPCCVSIGITDYLNRGAKITAPKGEAWVWEQLSAADVGATQNYKESYSYKLASRRTKAYAYENRGFDEDDSFIARPGIANYFITVKIHGESYGVYTEREGDKIFIDAPKGGYRTYALDAESYSEGDFEYAKSWTQSNALRYVQDAWREGRLYFKDLKTKKTVLQSMLVMV